MKACVEELKAENAALRADAKEHLDRIAELESRIRWQEEKLRNPPPTVLPVGEPPHGQQYGAGLMALCVNLARAIGLRPAAQALEIVFTWLGVEYQVPTYQSIRLWMQRVGLDRMKSAQVQSGGFWLVDHTNQIGKEKVLSVFRVLRFRPGRPLRHQDLEVLAMIPGEKWGRDEVKQVYEQLAQRYGCPSGVVTDGAVELREPAEMWSFSRQKPLVLRDPKHYLANRLEGLLTKDSRYQAFSAQLAGARSRLHQTELSHFVPPSAKLKARFMNLAPTLQWASSTIWHLQHPDSQSRKGIPPERMEDKLGWLAEFGEDVQRWQRCQEIVDRSLKLLNKDGLFVGVGKRLAEQLSEFGQCPMSRQLIAETVAFVRQQEGKMVHRGLKRSPSSTEVLESGYSRYKHLEKQHSKNGFTNLLLTMAVLLKPTTADEIAASLVRVRTKDVAEWTAQHCPSTLHSKRVRMFREANAAKKKAAKRATRAAVAA